MAPHQSEPDAKRETRENGMKQANAYALPVLMLKTLLRRKISSVILTAAILIATLASVILCGLRIRQETAIAEMIKNTQIRCTVTLDIPGFPGQKSGLRRWPSRPAGS